MADGQHGPTGETVTPNVVMATKQDGESVTIHLRVAEMASHVMVTPVKVVLVPESVILVSPIQDVIS